MENRFNLVEEPWIPIEGRGNVSLRAVFTEEMGNIGGTAVQKISLLKLLIAIAQSAYTPVDDDDWTKIGPDGMAQKCFKYLKEKKELFWLYGEKPFLQMKSLRKVEKNIKGSKIKHYSRGRAFLPDVPSANETILFQTQCDKVLSDAEKALLLISMMNYAPGGKRVENIGALSTTYTGKGVNAKAGPSLGGYVGYLNSCLLSNTVRNTIYLNIFTKSSIHEMGFWRDLSTTPPWEKMPKTEDDEAAKHIKNSIMGSLCGMSRFVLFKEEGMIYAEGLQYPSHKEGWREPFFSWNDKDKFLWLNTEKKPWRDFTALLNLPIEGGKDGFKCLQISSFWNRGRQRLPVIGIWSGGLKVRGTAGDQSVKQTDDFIESSILIPSENIGQKWFADLKNEIGDIDKLAGQLYGCIKRYFEEIKVKDSGKTGKALSEFWEITGESMEQIFLLCDDKDKMKKLNRNFATAVTSLYNTYCPSFTARQMTSWARNKPKLGKYYRTEEEVSVVKPEN